jgi:hypothetical protein
MLVIALDVNGATLARLDQHRVGDFALLKGAGVEVRDAGDDLFLLLGVRHDGRAILRRPAARARGQGRGCAEQGQEAPTGHAVFVARAEHGKFDVRLAFIHGVSRNRKRA